MRQIDEHDNQVIIYRLDHNPDRSMMTEVKYVHVQQCYLWMFVQHQKRLQSELDQARSKCQDFERTERLVRVDLERAAKRVRTVYLSLHP